MAEFIQVGVRLRPFLASEVGEEATPAVTIHGREVTVAGSTASHMFDHCFSSFKEGHQSWASQEKIFRSMGQRMVANAVSGFNGCVFVYGQTGSGKSYTVFGHRDSPGLVPRSVAQLFQRKHEIEATRTHELRIWLSFMELYNERITDLLWPDEDGQLELKVVDHPKFGTCVPQVTEAACQAVEDVEQLLDFGTKRRLTAATQMNERSSRSHAIFNLRLQLLEGMLSPAGASDDQLVGLAGLPVVSDTDDPRRALCSKMSLLDLAGSERQMKEGTVGVQFRAGCAINQSLAALAAVVKELTDPVHQAAPHSRALQQAAFRSSKLTLFLKEALTGNSKTSMIATLSPRAQDLGETATTLRFAELVGNIRTVAANSWEMKDEMMDQLRQEARRLRETAGEFSQGGEYQRMLSHIMKIYGEYNVQLVEAHVLNQAWRAVMSRNSLANNLTSSLPGVTEETPYLLSMSKDPQLAGCLTYYIPDEGPIAMGAAEESRIMLRGIGIAENLCEITNRDNLELRIEKMSAAGRIVVNGKSLREGEVKKLSHGDKLYLGRVHVFRVVLPASAKDGQAPDYTARLSLNGLDGEWAALEESFAWRGLKDYLEQVLAQIPADHAQALVDEMQRACILCDEANEITAECRPEDYLHFEVDLTSSVPSSIVICVSQADGPTPESDRWSYATLYMWSLRQMSERLERMRDYHETLMQTGSVVLDPLLDPWHEPHPAAFARKISELETLVQVEREQNEQLRLRQQQSMDKTIMLLRGGDQQDIARSVLGAWAAAVRSSLRAKERGSLSAAITTSAAAIPRRAGKEVKGAQMAGSFRDSGTYAGRGAGGSPRAVFKAGIAPARPPPRTQFLPSRESAQVVTRGKRSTSVSKKTRGGWQKSTIGGPAGAAPGVVRASSSPVGRPRCEDGDSSMLSVPMSPVATTQMGVPKRGLVAAPQEEQATNGDRTDSESEMHNEGMPQNTVSSENEMLRRQLEAAWHLCNVLRSQMTEQELEQSPRAPGSYFPQFQQSAGSDPQLGGNMPQPASVRSGSAASRVRTPHDADRGHAGIATIRTAHTMQPHIVTRESSEAFAPPQEQQPWTGAPRALPEGLRTRSHSPMATRMISHGNHRQPIGGITPSSPIRAQTVAAAPMSPAGTMQPIIYQQPTVVQVHTAAPTVHMQRSDRLAATMPVVTTAAYAAAAAAPQTTNVGQVPNSGITMRSWSRRGREGPS